MCCFPATEDVVDTVNATLYFLDETGGLAPVEMTLDLYEGDTQVGAVVKALLEGTEEKDWLSAIPEGFQVTSVRLEESTCYVDLPSAALPGLPEEADLSLALRALADSLLSLRAVEEVRYLVDGEFASAYGGAAVLEPYLSAVTARDAAPSCAEEQPHREGGGEKPRQVRGQGCRDRVAGADDARRAEVHGDGVECGFGAAQHHGGHPADVAVGAVGGDEVRADCQGAAAGYGAHQHQRRGLRRNAQKLQRRGAEAREPLQGAGSPEHGHGGQQSHQGRHDLSRTVSPSSAPWVRAP